MKELQDIQSKLKAPKDKQGSGVKYKYRSNEAILQAVKPLLNGAVLTQSDEIVLIGDRYYVKATTTLKTDSDSVSATGYARESETSRTGLDLAQLTGSCSSYARKYSISGLLLIDDNKDPDALAHQKTVVKTPKRSEVNKALLACKTMEDIPKIGAPFEKKYGKDIWFQPTGNPQNKAETWTMLFATHTKRVNGIPPVDANTSPDELQAEFDSMTSKCNDRETLMLIQTGVERQKALQTDANFKLLDTLHLAFPE